MLVLRGPWASFDRDPFVYGSTGAITYESDGLILIENGKILDCGSFQGLRSRVPAQVEIRHYKDGLILPGFIDTHVHYPQIQMMGSYGAQLLDWLQNYTFPAEQEFIDPQYARRVARVFLQESLRAGTTTSVVYGTVHSDSVDAIFEEASRFNIRLIAGKVLMDQNCPENLRDTPQSGYDDSKKLIERWHGQGRFSYAITPRFALSSSPEQLELAGELWRAFPGTYLQTHASENLAELRAVRDLFPRSRNYLDVYDRFGLLGPRSVLGHGVHFTDEEWELCFARGSAVAHCPTSNGFLGSGLFSFPKAKASGRPVRVGLATDLGAGTSFSLLRTMGEAYKISQLGGFPLSSAQAFYLATRGAAESLYLGDQVGSIAPGYEADLVVLNLRSTPFLDFRMNYCESLEDILFIQMIMADERAIQEVYVGGQSATSAKLGSPDLHAGSSEKRPKHKE